VNHWIGGLKRPDPWLQPLDAQTPWLAPFSAEFDACLQAWGAADWRDVFNQQAAASRLLTGAGKPLAFVAADALPEGMAYEQFVFETGAVPSRDNPHDFFNALIWLAFARSKTIINHSQAAQIQAHGVSGRRGGLRDFLTVLDESALLLQADLPAVDALARHDWQALLVRRRADWNPAAGALRPIIFGHALLEKLLSPYKSVTAHACVLDVPDGATKVPHRIFHALLEPKVAEEAHGMCGAAHQSLSSWDAALAKVLAAAVQKNTDLPLLRPLPVLGIPGWCAANADPAFYADARVFRPAPPLQANCRKGQCY
jgi:Protein of unknown function (DUF3025)